MTGTFQHIIAFAVQNLNIIYQHITGIGTAAHEQVKMVPGGRNGLTQFVPTVRIGAIPCRTKGGKLRIAMSVHLQTAIGLRCIALDPHGNGIFLTDHQIRTNGDTDMFIYVGAEEPDCPLILLAVFHDLCIVKPGRILGLILLRSPVSGSICQGIEQAPGAPDAIAVTHNTPKLR